MKISKRMLAALVPAMVSLAPVAAHATAPVVTVFNSTALGFGGDVVLTINGVDYAAFKKRLPEEEAYGLRAIEVGRAPIGTCGLLHAGQEETVVAL